MSHTDTPDGRWRKSSYSGPGDGNECVEVAASPARVSVRAPKAPGQAVLNVSGSAFDEFINALKERKGPPA
ncbi:MULTISPECIES: DUF397 domain-containing protein [Streptomyces]|jgi:hypothetical protein|uniref:DUF397 domain-containing protein n=1 Tax=Streptomyces thermocarboxydus TaxID=59299 RepID=A0ABU3JE75_9ACTN|nr:DUF397 domain-containing protein [Streptomyces thermocarboxydus]MXQ58494.1 DUF397 domain-containing protein [Streptomyces sp. XHT-2]